MAINFTPLTAYKYEVLDGIRQQAANQQRAASGLGAMLGTARGIYDAQKARDFFAQFDDSEEIAAIDEQIKANEERIKELEKELEGIGG
jgi:uncharacterized protein (DUF3084 family)